MSSCIGKLVVAAIMISTLFVVALSTLAVAAQPGDTSGTFRPGDLTTSKDIGAQGKPEGLSGPGARAPLLPALDSCYMSCRTTESGIMKYLCSLGCGYSTDFPPMIP
jgi:hypothetical protein